MKTLINGLFTIVFALLAPQIVQAQGFVNLDFEGANISGYSAGSVPASDAIPGWMAYLGGTPLSNINYNTGGSGNMVEIVGVNPIQGNYFIHIQGNGSDNTQASIGQTGTIPVTAQSLIFWGGGLGQNDISFNGHTLSFTALGFGANYVIYGIDISAFAGQTGQLLFTSSSWPAAVGDNIDNIQFSSSPIPEPSAVSLLLLGCGVLIYARRIHQKHFRS
jgi:hypothetical protein